jgi:hypothetical protein
VKPHDYYHSNGAKSVYVWAIPQASMLRDRMKYPIA